MLLSILQVAFAAVVCEPWCAEPCAELNGEVTAECSGCTGPSGCFPGAAGFIKALDGVADGARLEVLIDVSGTASRVDACHDRAGGSRCEFHAHSGHCTSHRAKMARHCALTCSLCSEFEATSPCAERGCDEKLSVSGAAAHDSGSEYISAGNEERRFNGCSAAATLLRAAQCGQLEDEARLRDRGFFVVRGAVGESELAKMRAHVQALPLPIQRLCGASDVQPEPCQLYGNEEVQQRFPELYAMLSALFARWHASGLASAAHLGWPLDIIGGEFISINSWPFAQNASCVLSAVYAAAEEYVSSECIHACAPADRTRSTSDCWARCRYEAVTQRVPPARLRGVLRDAMHDAGQCVVNYTVVDGPMEVRAHLATSPSTPHPAPHRLLRAARCVPYSEDHAR